MFIHLVPASHTSLSRREADIAVRLSRSQEPDLVACKVATVQFHLYGSADHLAKTTACKRWRLWVRTVTGFLASCFEN
ncbi:MAG: hypothetical protein ABWY46_09090 [Pseudomonas sp.]|jgi:DNA-binding transcriptional LysR family regulator